MKEKEEKKLAAVRAKEEKKLARVATKEENAQFANTSLNHVSQALDVTNTTPNVEAQNINEDNNADKDISVDVNKAIEQNIITENNINKQTADGDKQHFENTQQIQNNVLEKVIETKLINIIGDVKKDDIVQLTQELQKVKQESEQIMSNLSNLRSTNPRRVVRLEDIERRGVNTTLILIILIMAMIGIGYIA